MSFLESVAKFVTLWITFLRFPMPKSLLMWVLPNWKKNEQKKGIGKNYNFFLILNYFYVNTVALMRLLIKYLLLATGAWFTRHEKWRRIAAATGAQCVHLFSEDIFRILMEMLTVFFIYQNGLGFAELKLFSM